jgi:hypothetical protein
LTVKGKLGECGAIAHPIEFDDPKKLKRTAK